MDEGGKKKHFSYYLGSGKDMCAFFNLLTASKPSEIKLVEGDPTTLIWNPNFGA